jgi:sugar phosphate isomerase/epimerase
MVYQISEEKMALLDVNAAAMAISIVADGRLDYYINSEKVLEDVKKKLDENGFEFGVIKHEYGLELNPEDFKLSIEDIKENKREMAMERISAVNRNIMGVIGDNPRVKFGIVNMYPP